MKRRRLQGKAFKRWRRRCRDQRPSGPGAWRTLFNKPVFDLGAAGNETLRGIFSPSYDTQIVDHYLHTQFRESASVYAEKYAGVELFTGLLSQAFESIQWQ